MGVDVTAVSSIAQLLAVVFAISTMPWSFRILLLELCSFNETGAACLFRPITPNSSTQLYEDFPEQIRSSCLFVEKSICLDRILLGVSFNFPHITEIFALDLVEWTLSAPLPAPLSIATLVGVELGSLDGSSASLKMQQIFKINYEIFD